MNRHPAFPKLTDFPPLAAETAKAMAADTPAIRWLIAAGPAIERAHAEMRAEEAAEREAQLAEAADRAAMIHLPDFLREKPWGQYYDLTRGLWTGDSRETRPEPEYEPSEGELRRVAAWGRRVFGPGMGD